MAERSLSCHFYELIIKSEINGKRSATYDTHLFIK